MKRQISAAATRFVAAMVCAVLLFVALPGGAVIIGEAETTSAKISKLHDQIKKNEREQSTLKSEIAAKKSDINSVLQTKAYLDKQINLKADKIKMTEELIEQYGIEIEEMMLKLGAKESSLKKEYESFRTHLRISYEDKDTSLFELLFSSESLLDFLINAERTSVLLDYEKKHLADLNAQAEDLNKMKVELEGVKAEAHQTSATLKADKADLEKSSYDALIYVKSQEKELKKDETKYAELSRANEELDAELEKQLKELAAQSQKIYVGGEFAWPLDLKYNRISSYFAARSFNGIKEFHKAIDIPAVSGSNIYAANGGTVVTATYHSSYGNYVVIDHGGGKATLYAHCSRLLVKAGDNVSQGDVIALVGTTGYSSGPHLHFEVRVNGTAQNPLNYVVKP